MSTRSVNGLLEAGSDEASSVLPLSQSVRFRTLLRGGEYRTDPSQLRIYSCKVLWQRAVRFSGTSRAASPGYWCVFTIPTCTCELPIGLDEGVGSGVPNIYDIPCQSLTT